ncbi:MAG: ribose transporter permease [Sphaerisporangium sp.]|nr:ribose transporter permease [Sphaerisporangium sp.]
MATGNSTLPSQPKVETSRSGLSRGQDRKPITVFAERYALVGAWIVLAIFFSFLRPDTFPTIGNLSAILGSQASIAVLTLGLIIPLTTGDMDASVAFVSNLSAMMVAVLNVNLGVPIGWAILAALASGALVGGINGAFVTIFGIDSFIVTLGMGTFVGGVILLISQSNTISGVSDVLTQAVVITQFLGIPLEFYYAIAVGLFLWYVLEWTPLGRRLIVVGRGRNVARLSGLRVQRIRWGALIASGTISALAGVLYVGTSGAADPTSGSQLLLPAFAAAYLGATCIKPGRFNPIGSLIAVYFLVTGISGLQLLGAQGYVQNLFYGGALVIAVTLSQLTRKREEISPGNSQ